MKTRRFLSILTTVIMIISMLPLGMMTAYADGEGDASLISVLSKTISTGSETGNTTAEAKTASISVESTVSELSDGDVKVL